MQQVVCPGCGAPVQFKSSASVMAVCDFCKTTLLKDADSVKSIGKMSEVLEDYSPLQINTSGQFGQRAFSLIGRIQLQYEAGFWNEWYVLFEDGSNGWLSDASGQFAVTFEKTIDAPLPLFEKLLPGRSFNIAGKTYAAADVRTARCTAGQGELPFKVGPGWEAKVADFRTDGQFLSLDYSDSTLPRIYVGQAVELADLKLQLLRDADQIKDAAGRYHGRVQALNCPSCGAPVQTVPGLTVQLLCPSCHAQVDTSQSVATVLAAGEAAAAVKFSAALGSEAVLDGVTYTVLGAMRRADDEGYQWSEYLVFAAGKRFQWLVETDEGWQRAQVLDRWPAWDGAARATLDGIAFAKSSEYNARVVYAIGSFNWRVSVGDVTQVLEFSAGAVRLAAEMSSQELTWSRSAKLPLDQVRAWFGDRVKAAQSAPTSYVAKARSILIVLFLINAIPLIFASSNAIPYALLGWAAIYLPAYFLDRMGASPS